jgi:hypothetical protein
MTSKIYLNQQPVDTDQPPWQSCPTSTVKAGTLPSLHHHALFPTGGERAGQHMSSVNAHYWLGGAKHSRVPDLHSSPAARDMESQHFLEAYIK